MKLGSLFDGSGGFPLAGALCGIEPVWAAEVEPYPIAVTKSRFPNMKHLGSVTDVKGDKIEPVDIITFGSPCQSLSVAGKREGIRHTDLGDEETTRSGLFIEAVRIIKEMREATNGVYPRFAVWENVPGAFSSSRGEDFRTVLEMLIQIAEPSAVMPDVPKGGWAYADSYRGNGWSIAYRVFDAQYWGVPQRRRRIYLVADFRGECAGEILFKSHGLRGYFEEGRAPWKGTAPNAERGSATNDCEGVPYTLKIRSGVERDSGGKAAGKGALIQEDKSATLSTVQDQYLFQPVTFEPGIAQREGGHIYEGVCGTLRANAGDNRMAVAYDGATPAVGFDAYNQALTGDKSKTLNSAASDSDHVPCAVYSVENHPADSRVNVDDSGKVQTLTSRMGTGGGNVPMVMEPVTFDARGNGNGKVVSTITGVHESFISDYTSVVCYCLQDKSIGRKEANSCHGLGVSEETAYTLTGIDRHAVAYGFDPGASRDVGDLWLEEQSKTLTNGTCPGHHNGVVCETYQKVTGPLMANTHPGSYTGQDAFSDMLVAGKREPHRYIVRRLTPTECARLQGFPDKWGHPDIKEKFTKEEYEFWLDVRNTHAIINGKATKQYTKEQMLSWYNKLHTDAAEYKMWGNGIALPTALYVLQGIAGVKE